MKPGFGQKDGVRREGGLLENPEVFALQAEAAGRGHEGHEEEQNDGQQQGREEGVDVGDAGLGGHQRQHALQGAAEKQQGRRAHQHENHADAAVENVDGGAEEAAGLLAQQGGKAAADFGAAEAVVAADMLAEQAGEQLFVKQADEPGEQEEGQGAERGQEQKHGQAGPADGLHQPAKGREAAQQGIAQGLEGGADVVEVAGAAKGEEHNAHQQHDAKQDVEKVFKARAGNEQPDDAAEQKREEGRNEGEEDPGQQKKQDKAHAAAAAICQPGDAAGQQKELHHEEDFQIQGHEAGQHDRKGGDGQAEHQVYILGGKEQALREVEGEEGAETDAHDDHNHQHDVQPAHGAESACHQKGVVARDKGHDEGQQQEGRPAGALPPLAVPALAPGGGEQ